MEIFHAKSHWHTMIDCRFSRTTGEFKREDNMSITSNIRLNKI